MEVLTVDVGNYRFPFSELLINNKFVLSDVEASPTFVKTGTFSYKNLLTEEESQISQFTGRRFKLQRKSK